MVTAYLAHPSDSSSKLNGKNLESMLSPFITIVNPFNQNRAATHNAQIITDGDINDVLQSNIFILYLPTHSDTIGCGGESERAYLHNKLRICLVNQNLVNHYWIQRWFGNNRFFEYSKFEIRLKEMITQFDDWRNVQLASHEYPESIDK